MMKNNKAFQISKADRFGRVVEISDPIFNLKDAIDQVDADADWFQVSAMSHEQLNLPHDISVMMVEVDENGDVLDDIEEVYAWCAD